MITYPLFETTVEYLFVQFYMKYNNPISWYLLQYHTAGWASVILVSTYSSTTAKSTDRSLFTSFIPPSAVVRLETRPPYRVWGGDVFV